MEVVSDFEPATGRAAGYPAEPHAELLGVTWHTVWEYGMTSPDPHHDTHSMSPKFREVNVRLRQHRWLVRERAKTDQVS